MVAEPPDRDAHEWPHQVVVVDDQHRLRAAAGRRGVRYISGTTIADGTRQVELHRGAHTQFAPHVDEATRLLDKTVDHAQAESGAAAHRLGGEERLERAVQDVRRHARAGVGDRDSHVVVGGTLLRAVALEGDVLGHDLQGARGIHRVAAVRGDVHQRSLQLAAVDDDHPRVGTRRERDLHVGSNRASQERQHLVDHRVRVRRLRLQRLTAGEDQQSVGEVCPIDRRSHDRVGEWAEPRIVAQLGGQHLRATEHHREQVVEVVGDAAGEVSQ